MKRSIDRKTGDVVPVEHDLYFVVEKTFEKTDTTEEYEDYSDYKLGETIVIEANELKRCLSSFKEFLDNNCRLATDDEITNIYNELYSNARIGSVYQDGAYDVWRFFVVESHFDELWEKFDMKNDNCYWALRREMKDIIGKLCGESDMFFVCIGYYKSKMFLFTRHNDKGESLLKICRRATQEETVELCKYVNQTQEVYRKNIEDERRKKEEAKAKIYEANKSNSEYFPGVGGNYKQVLLEEGKKVVPEKEYSLEQINSFYQTLLGFDGLSDEVKSNMIFYGGTIPYVLCNEKGSTRKFGDVDIFLPVSMMHMFRDELSGELNYVYDSIKLTKKVRLIANNKYVYQDYGFKAILFGVNISVFPLYDWIFQDGSIGVCAKSFRLSKEKGDWNFLLNTIVSKGITVDDFGKEVSIFGQKVKIAKMEYTIASKTNAIKFGYVLRLDTDMADLKYIEAHKKELEVDESQLQFFMDNIPDYGISYVYRITRTYDAEVMSPEEYKHIVTRNDKPS